MKQVINNIAIVCIHILTISMISGCGLFFDLGGGGDDDDDDSSAASGPDPMEATLNEEPKYFEGYVVSAFEVVVDGEGYQDMEDFYTEELNRLPEKVMEAGYDEEWDVRFEAQVGLSDLWQNMQVFITPDAELGYQAVTHVGSAGRFMVSMPHTALDIDYRIRANKRINIVLRKENEVVRICYNFSAHEQQVHFTRESLPVILDTFSTRITSYECSVETSGVTIPDGPDVEGNDKLQAGMDKSSVVGLLGLDGLNVDSSTKWCWASAPDEAGVCEYLGTEGEKCQCWVEYNEEGLLLTHENISSRFL